MPRLYLVRHAIAEERNAERWPDDALRPLSDRGARRFIEAARGLRDLGMTPAVSLTSPYARAVQTAALLETYAGWPAALQVDAFASDDIDAQVEALRALAAETSVGVVGHEPHLSGLASWLLAGDGGTIEFDWRKGGIAALEWNEPRAGGAQLVAFAPPRLLRR